MVRVCKSSIIFLCIHPSLHLSICLSHCLLNLQEEFNQTSYISSPHGKGVQKQHFFSVPPSFVHLSIMLSPPKPLGRIRKNIISLLMIFIPFHTIVIVYFIMVSLWWSVFLSVWGGGRVVRRCRVSYVTGASYWYWLTVGQGLLSW